MDNPFPVISSQIISALKPGNELQKSVKDNAIKITKNLLKFGAKTFGKLDISELLPDPEQEKVDLIAFKQSMQQAIAEKGTKVVLVVDELDRCKPDYAVKALETIKHFFDIDGLFVILTTKVDFMNKICEAYYGHPQCEVNMEEGYIQKFVQSTKILNPTSKEDYRFIINRILNKDTLPVRMPGYGQVLVRNSSENLHAISVFQNNMAELFYAAKFSIRKTNDVCNEFLNVVNKHKGKIWERMYGGFPEFIWIRYLKAKALIPDKFPDPKVGWDHKDLSRINNFIEETLKELL